MPIAKNEDTGKSPTEFSPPRAFLRALPNPIDPPSANRPRMTYPYGDEYPDGVA